MLRTSVFELWPSIEPAVDDDQVKPNVVTCSAAISACEKDSQWHLGGALACWVVMVYG